MGMHEKPQFRKASICSCGQHGFAGLTRGHVTLFSPQDIGVFRVSNWGLLNGSGNTSPYARRTSDQKLAQRIITGASRDKVVDHVSGDTLDNRRGNLRICTHAQNVKNQKRQKNAARFKGIAQTASGMWCAFICTDGDRQYLGGFASDIEAAQAYDAAALRLHGEFARTNKMMGLL